ncbi:MAG: SET domain-containing protein-lysine N-methyltransferase [Actinomycetota bacterium]|nr:SET domain-containing protein-lysine N-methyltransferase [Acidimicrobiia bacterium]MDQ3294397.1 SET domain-containing protein-lysine N-methyltransferase [Actinomycetota bacterium]
MPPPPTDEIASTTRTYVAPSPYGGRGVFAAEPIAAGEVVEVAPVLVVEADEIEALNGTALRDHWYGWGDDGDAAVGLGHASLYNHAADPSCDYEAHDTIDALVLVARRAIAVDEELTIDYTGGGVNELWFDPR